MRGQQTKKTPSTALAIIVAILVSFSLLFAIERYLVPHAPSSWITLDEGTLILFMEFISFSVLLGAFFLNHIMHVVSFIGDSYEHAKNNPWLDLLYIFVALSGSLGIYFIARYILVSIGDTPDSSLGVPMPDLNLIRQI